MTPARKQLLLIMGASIVFLILLALAGVPEPLLIVGLFGGVFAVIATLTLVAYTLVEGSWPWSSP